MLSAPPPTPLPPNHTHPYPAGVAVDPEAGWVQVRAERWTASKLDATSAAEGSAVLASVVRATSACVHETTAPCSYVLSDATFIRTTSSHPIIQLRTVIPAVLWRGCGVWGVGCGALVCHHVYMFLEMLRLSIVHHLSIPPPPTRHPVCRPRPQQYPSPASLPEGGLEVLCGGSSGSLLRVRFDTAKGTFTVGRRVGVVDALAGACPCTCAHGRVSGRRIHAVKGGGAVLHLHVAGVRG